MSDFNTLPSSDTLTPPDPVPPITEDEMLNAPPKKNNTTIILLVIAAILMSCICFVLGIVFGIWAWETGDQWFSLLPLAAAMM